MLSSAELTATRATQATTFDQTGVIKRKTGSDDGAGGSLPGTPTTVATVACRLGPSQTSDREEIVAAGIQSMTVWRITVPQGTDIRRTDYVEIGSRAFEVMAVYGPRTNETARVALGVER